MTDEQKIKLRRRINDYLCKYATEKELIQIANHLGITIK